MCVPPVLTGRVTAMTDAQWHGYSIVHPLIIYTFNVHPASLQPSHRQAYKQTDVQTESDETHATAASRWTDGRTDRQTGKQADVRTD